MVLNLINACFSLRKILLATNTLVFSNFGSMRHEISDSSAD